MLSCVHGVAPLPPPLHLLHGPGESVEEHDGVLRVEHRLLEQGDGDLVRDQLPL